MERLMSHIYLWRICEQLLNWTMVEFSVSNIILKVTNV